MKCPNCDFENPRDMHFCGMCGTRLTTTCSSCGFGNPLDYRFCGMCGTRLASEEAEVSLQPLQAPAENEAESQTVSAAIPPVEAERRDVTVIITDLTDSTKLLEKSGTEGWVELMNRILHILESEIYRFGGEIGQFRGDGLVAFFGATAAHEDDPERAVLAALSMQRAFDLYVRELPRPEAKDLRMRVGVDTGEVIVATANSRHRWEETAMGLAVSIAARMETAAEPGTVLVSEHTYRLTQSQFEWQLLGEILVKGVSQPIPVFRPLQALEDAKKFPADEAFPDTFPHIGRESEFSRLKACVEGLFEGRGHIAVLTGDTGSGKSFLMNDLGQYFAHRNTLLEENRATSGATSLQWVRGRCRSYNQTWPYSMWLDLFRNWLELRPEDSREERRERLRQRAQEVWGDALDEYYPYLASLLGLPLEPDYVDKIRHLDGEALRQQYFAAVQSWIETSSRKGPLVVALSDLHWADDSSLALLKHCLPVCDSEALLWLLSFRLDRASPVWESYLSLEVDYPHRLTRVDLPPLSKPQSVALISQLIGPTTLPLEARDLIIHNSEGNPYYIIELLRALIAQGILVRQPEDGPWHATRSVTTLDLPNSLQRLLLSRIDRLEGHQRLVLQIAAVIGSVFWSNMVQALLGETQTLKADLAALQRNQFIQESGNVPKLGMQYVFRSPLVREAVYDSLLSTQKSMYHLRVAEYMENHVSPEALEDYEGTVAYHYQCAGNSRKELFYTVLAAEQARRIYANKEALQYYDRATSLLEQLEKEFPVGEQRRSILTQFFEVLMGRRSVLLDLGEIDAARADTYALLPLAHQMADDRIWLIEALLAHAEFPAGNRDDLRPSLKMGEEALDLARELGDRRRELFALISVASIRLNLREPDALRLGEEALALARELGDLRTEVSILLGIGNVYGVDNLPRSREYLEVALDRSKSLNDKRVEILLLQALGQQFERAGDYYRQLTEYEHKRLQLGREIGNRDVEGQAMMFCGQIRALYLGDYEAGLTLEKEVLRIWGPIPGRLFPMLRIAQILTAQGRYDEALPALEAARPLADKVVMDTGRAGLVMVNIMLFNALGDEAHLWSALELVAQIQQMTTDNLVSQQYRMAAACEASDTHLKLARHLRERDQDQQKRHIAQALESSGLAFDLYQHFGFVQIVECTSEEILYRHSQALAANDRSAEAADFLQRAHKEMMRKHDLIPKDRPFRKTFLENIESHCAIQAAYSAHFSPASAEPARKGRKTRKVSS